MSPVSARCLGYCPQISSLLSLWFEDWAGGMNCSYELDELSLQLGILGKSAFFFPTVYFLTQS